MTTEELLTLIVMLEQRYAKALATSSLVTLTPNQLRALLDSVIPPTDRDTVTNTHSQNTTT